MNTTDRGVSRNRLLSMGLRIEVLSLVWVTIETALGGLAAIQVGSLAISAFSVDSGVELLSGIVLLIRLAMELRFPSNEIPHWVERLASGLVGICLFTLAGFISYKSGQALAVQQAPAMSTLGLGVAALSSLITPWLAVQKKKIGTELHSHALLGDAACSMTCAYMAWTLLLGLVCEWQFGWWWVDPVAALGILYFVLREAWESAAAAWTGAVHVHGHHA